MKNGQITIYSSISNIILMRVKYQTRNFTNLQCPTQTSRMTEKKEKTAKTKGKMHLFIQKHCIKVEHICISPSWDGKKLDISLFGIFILVIVSPHNRVNVYRVLSPALLYCSWGGRWVWVSVKCDAVYVCNVKTGIKRNGVMNTHHA